MPSARRLEPDLREQTLTGSWAVGLPKLGMLLSDRAVYLTVLTVIWRAWGSSLRMAITASSIGVASAARSLMASVAA